MIITVSRDEGLRHALSDALRATRWGDVVTHVTTVGAAEELLSGPDSPRVLVVGDSIGLEGAADLAKTAAGLRHPPAVLLVAPPTTELLRAAMRAGIRDVLPVEFTADDVVSAFDSAGVGSDGPPALPGLTVAVFSTKGGVGTSVVASNLAVQLAERLDTPVTLADLDLASADQAIMHGLSPRWTIQDIADGAVGTDVESLRQVLMELPGHGVRLLPGPIDPALAERISATGVSATIAAIRAESRMCVLDTSSGFDDRTLAAIDAADAIVITSSLDVAALRALTVSLQTFRQLEIDDHKLFVTLVRSDSKSGLTIADVERAIDRPVDVGIPSTRAVPRSVNEGVPLAVSSPRSDVVKAIDNLAELVLAVGPRELTGDKDSREPGSSSGGPLSWILGRGSDRSSDDAASDTTDAVRSVPDEPPPGDSSAAEDEDEVSPAQVLSIEERRQAPPPRRRVVTRRADSPTDGGDVPDDVEESPVRSLPDVQDMPPPIVVSDDDDDQPRRRRRR